MAQRMEYAFDSLCDEFYILLTLSGPNMRVYTWNNNNNTNNKTAKKEPWAC